MLVLFHDSISSISTSQIHHPLCQSTRTRKWQDAAFAPRISGVSSHPDVNTTAITWRYVLCQRNTSIGWKQRVKQPCFRSSDWLFTSIVLPHVGSFGTLQISSLNNCEALIPWYPIPISSFQPPLPAQKETAIQSPCRKIKKKRNPPGPKHLWSLVFAYKI